MVILDISEYYLNCHQLINTHNIPRNLSKAQMHSTFIKWLQQTAHSHPITPISSYLLFNSKVNLSLIAYVQRDLWFLLFSMLTNSHLSWAFRSINHRTSCSWLKKAELKSDQLKFELQKLTKEHKTPLWYTDAAWLWKGGHLFSISCYCTLDFRS